MSIKTKLERAAGIEPASSAWKAEVIATIRCPRAISGGGGWIRTSEAFASDLQSDPFGHSGTPPVQIRCRESAKTLKWSWRTESNPRPADTRQLLYQLSYASSHSPRQRGRYTTDFFSALQHLCRYHFQQTRSFCRFPLQPLEPSRFPGQIQHQKRGRIVYDYGGTWPVLH